MQEKCDLIEIGNVFDHLNIVYKKHLNKKIINGSQFQNDFMIISESLRCKVVIEQLDVYKHVFVKLIDQLENSKGKYKWIMLTFGLCKHYAGKCMDNFNMTCNICTSYVYLEQFQIIEN